MDLTGKQWIYKKKYLKYFHQRCINIYRRRILISKLYIKELINCFVSDFINITSHFMFLDLMTSFYIRKKQTFFDGILF